MGLLRVLYSWPELGMGSTGNRLVSPENSLRSTGRRRRVQRSRVASHWFSDLSGFLGLTGRGSHSWVLPELLNRRVLVLATGVAPPGSTGHGLSSLFVSLMLGLSLSLVLSLSSHLSVSPCRHLSLSLNLSLTLCFSLNSPSHSLRDFRTRRRKNEEGEMKKEEDKKKERKEENNKKSKQLAVQVVDPFFFPTY
jgi:hypothetical protein